MISDEKYITPQNGDDIAKLTQTLFENQLEHWQLASKNYTMLKTVKTKKIIVNDSNILVQFNPSRIVSSAAKTDEKSINERKCFLCMKNIPNEQRGIKIFNNFIILVNPFPIFKQHLTITNIKHTPQLIKNNIDTMIELSDILHNYVIFYNGPKCGASAPDHLHFQAGNKGFLPIETEFETNKNNIAKHICGSVEITFDKNLLKRTITMQSNNKDDLTNALGKTYKILGKLQPDETEPMLNIICYAGNKSHTVHIFPRAKHRPTQFFEKGKNRFLISPASVDYGGVLITPREEDFEKITTKDVIDIFNQTSISKTNFEIISNQIKKELI